MKCLEFKNAFAMTSEATEGTSGRTTVEVEERMKDRDRRLRKNIGKNREMKKKKFAVKCAKCK